MKSLLILAECPDKIAAALEYGPGRLSCWCDDALDCMLEGDFDGSTWADDVERLYGVRSSDCVGAFRCRGARFVDSGVADAAALLLEAASRRSPVFQPGTKAEGGAK